MLSTAGRWRVSPACALLSYDERERCNHQYVVLEIDEAAAGISRDALLHILHAEKVLARRYFYPGCHRMEPYRSYFPNAGLLLPQTERLGAMVLSLPTGSAIAPEQISTICQIITFVCRHSKEVAGALRKPLAPTRSVAPMAASSRRRSRTAALTT